MKKGTHAAAPVQKPTEGKKDTSKPKGSDVKFGYAPAGRRGTSAK